MLSCPIDKLHSVLGSHGIIIKEIMRLTNTKIYITHENNNNISNKNRNIIIIGSDQPSIIHANDLLIKVINTATITTYRVVV